MTPQAERVSKSSADLPGSTSKPRASNACVVAVGAGGAVGSELVSHIARSPEVAELILIDPDVYEAKNLSSQAIEAADVGKPKVLVQARRLRRIRPELRVTPLAAAVEDVPLGRLRSDAILSSPDSREARRVVNEAAFRLGVPWIDAAVEASSLLARVNVYFPGPEHPCIECGWGERDYEALEQRYLCAGRARRAETAAPAALGAFAASLAALECRKLLRGEIDSAAAGREVLVDLLHHAHQVTASRRHPECRFDHARWDLERLAWDPERRTLGDLAVEASRRSANGAAPSLRVWGQYLARSLACLRCGAGHKVFHLRGRLEPRRLHCRACGGRLAAGGLGLIEDLTLDEASPALLRRTLRSIGIEAGDVLTVESEMRPVHIEIGGGS
jgi:molybdopterin/thiamine biosynthesis adenylyltransferase